MLSLPHLPRATHTRAQHAPVPISNWHLATKCDTLARAAPSHARITHVFTHTFVRVRVRHRRRNSQSVFRMLLLAHAEGFEQDTVLDLTCTHFAETATGTGGPSHAGQRGGRRVASKFLFSGDHWPGHIQ